MLTSYASKSMHWMKSRLPSRKSGIKKRSTAMKSAAPAFPKTQQDLLSVLAPLMQWLDVRGQSDAMRFDMDILAAQTARYTNPEELDVLWPVIVEKWSACRRIWRKSNSKDRGSISFVI